MEPLPAALQTPDDDATKRYTALQLGYLGGAVKVNCKPEQLVGLEVGQTLKVQAAMLTNGKEAKFDLIAAKAA